MRRRPNGEVIAKLKDQAQKKDARVKPGHDDADGISQAVIAGLARRSIFAGLKQARIPASSRYD
jgi:hypothetical protein